MYCRNIDHNTSSKASDIFLTLLIVISFLVQLFIGVFQSRGVFIVVVLCIALLYFITIRVFKCSLKISYKSTLWLMLIAIAISTYRGSHTINNTSDFIIFSIFSLIIFSVGTDAGAYCKILSIVRAISIAYAISVWIQLLMPGIYRTIMDILFGTTITENVEKLQRIGYYTGFSTNPGFTAGHLVAGLFSAITVNKIFPKHYNKFITVFLLISLLLTGKRAHALFVMISFFFLYLYSGKRQETLKKYGKIFLAITVLVLLFTLLKDYLALIPGVSRMVDTISSLLLGEDISNGRARLHAWAMMQFINHPVLGIGWGNARLWSFGSVLFTKSMDTHNVYIQLLCETGVLGFVAVCSVFLAFLTKSVKLERGIASGEIALRGERWQFLLDYALLYQVFFLLYCISGNPLYDHNYQMMYLFSLSLVVGFDNITKKIEGKY